MDESSSNMTLILPRGDGIVRVIVSSRLLERAPWLPKGLEATISVAGKWWPDEVFVGDDLDWVCHNHATPMFYLQEWVVEAPVGPRKKRQTRPGFYRSFLFRLVPEMNSGGVEDLRMWYLGHAMYQSLSRRDSDFVEFFLPNDFAAAVRNEAHKRVHGETATWRFILCFILMIPFALYASFTIGVCYVVLSTLGRCFPRFRAARLRKMRMRRRLRKFRREISTAMRKHEDKSSIDEVIKARSENR